MMDYLKGFCYIEKKEFAKAESLYTALSQEGGNSMLLSSIHYLISKSKQGKNLPQKSPASAAILSTFVPGLGMGYTGKWGDGLFSFLAVFVTAAPAVYFWEEDRTFAITTGIAALFFYSGNIYGSAVSAHNFNDKTTSEFIHNTINSVPYSVTNINSTYQEQKSGR
jgi:TM2 domain-containing membrane protein YozV